MASRTNGGERLQLVNAVSNHSEELLEQMNANSKMLNALSKSGLITQADERKLENIKDKEQRNIELIQIMLENESKVPDSLEKFVNALNVSDQKRLASVLKSGKSSGDRNDRGRNASTQPANKSVSPDDRKFGNPNPDTRGNGSSNQGRSQSLGGEQNGARRDRRSSPQDNGRGRQQRNQSVSPDRSNRQTTGRNASPPSDRGGRRKRDNSSDRYDNDYRGAVSNRDYGEISVQLVDQLRGECDEVARKNADLMEKLRHVNSLVHKVKPVGVVTNGADPSWDIADGQSTTHKQLDEAEHYVISVRDHMSAIVDDIHDTDQQVAACEALIEKMRNEIAERNMALIQLDENEEETFRQRQMLQPLSPTTQKRPPLSTTRKMSPDGGDVSHGQRTSRLAHLRSSVANLSAEVDAYVHRERQHTMMPRWPGKEPGPHRNFDQIDHDFQVLMREVRQNDRQSSVQSIQRLADVTKTEREDCVRICDDIQRLVQKRRIKIQELLQQHMKQNSSSGNGNGNKNFEPLKNSPVLPRKVRTTRSVESALSRRIVELGDEMKLCIELEFDLNQKVRDDYAKRRIEFDERMHAVSLDIKRLERRAKEAETERDRYRRLYEQAQIVQMSRLLTRPTVVKRSTSKNKGRRAFSVSLDGAGVSLPTIRRRGYEEDPIPSKSMFFDSSRTGKKGRTSGEVYNNDEDRDDVSPHSEDVRRSEPSWHGRQGDQDNDNDRSWDRQPHQQHHGQQQPQQPQVAVHIQSRPHEQSNQKSQQSGYQTTTPRSDLGDPNQRRSHPQTDHRESSDRQKVDDRHQTSQNQNGTHNNYNPSNGTYDERGYYGNGHHPDSYYAESYANGYREDVRQYDSRNPVVNGRGQPNGYPDNGY